MSGLLENMWLVIDTREETNKSPEKKKRKDIIKSWFEYHGGDVQNTKLNNGDYYIGGTFSNARYTAEINLNIEYKTLPNLAGDLAAKNNNYFFDKMACTLGEYDDVALFVETGAYGFTPNEDNFHATISDPGIRDKQAREIPLIQLAVMENLFESLQGCQHIHVRQLQSEYHFPYAVAGLLTYISHSIHFGAILTKDMNRTKADLNILSRFEGVGYQSAKKITEQYSNIAELSYAHEEEIEQKLGKKIAKNVYSQLHHNERYYSHPVSFPQNDKPGTISPGLSKSSSLSDKTPSSTTAKAPDNKAPPAKTAKKARQPETQALGSTPRGATLQLSGTPVTDDPPGNFSKSNIPPPSLNDVPAAILTKDIYQCPTCLGKEIWVKDDGVKKFSCNNNECGYAGTEDEEDWNIHTVEAVTARKKKDVDMKAPGAEQNVKPKITSCASEPHIIDFCNDAPRTMEEIVKHCSDFQGGTIFDKVHELFNNRQLLRFKKADKYYFRTTIRAEEEENELAFLGV